MDELTPICQMKDLPLGGSTTCRRESLEPLQDYKHRVLGEPSDICTDCGASPQDVRYLFACTTHPTDLSLEDLWRNPVGSIRVFSYFDNGKLDWHDDGPGRGKQQQLFKTTQLIHSFHSPKPPNSYTHSTLQNHPTATPIPLSKTTQLLYSSTSIICTPSLLHSSTSPTPTSPLLHLSTSLTLTSPLLHPLHLSYTHPHFIDSSTSHILIHISYTHFTSPTPTSPLLHLPRVTSRTVIRLKNQLGLQPILLCHSCILSIAPIDSLLLVGYLQ